MQYKEAKKDHASPSFLIECNEITPNRQIYQSTEWYIKENNY